MYKTTLTKQLWNLLQLTAQEAESEGIMTDASGISSLYVKTNILDFDPIKSSYSESFELVEKPRPDFRKRERFLDSIKKTPEFSQTVKMICRTYSETNSQASFWVSLLLQRALQLTPLGDNSQISALITMFICDLENTPRAWTGVAWLEGAKILLPKLELETNLILRQPISNDFELERPIEDFIYGAVDHLRFRGSPTAILEFSIRAKDQGEVHKKMMRVIATLRLFKVGSVFHIKLTEKADSVISFGISTSSSLRSPGINFTYEIKAEDVDELQSFYKKVSPLIPVEDLIGTPPVADYITIALLRYSDALLSTGDVGAKLAWTIMCLEALYLKSEERDELSERLALRAGRVLRQKGVNGNEAYSDLKEAYDIRSTYIHGGHLDTKQQVKAGGLYIKCIEYARKSFLTFLLLKANDIEKNAFLNRITNSFLSPDADSRLMSDLVKTNISTN